MELLDATYTVGADSGYIYLTGTYDGVPLRIMWEQKYLDHDAVFVGNKAFTATILYQWHADEIPEIMTLKEFIKDPQLADQVRRYLDDFDSGKATPGKVLPSELFKGGG